jgi:peptide deformylase
MAIRAILRLGNPILRLRAKEVTPEEIQSPEFQTLVDDMIETMRAVSGAGLAAPQIGESIRLAVAEVQKNPRYPQMGDIPLAVWVNPRVTLLSEDISVVMYEGCLSVPGLRGKVTRNAHIRLDALDRHGDAQVFEYRGAEAAVIQHELDHLDGTLFIDKADPKTITYLEEYDLFVPPIDRLRVITAPE